MIKNIEYKGFTVVPSDYECPDGDLAGAFNLVQEDGALHPIQPAESTLTLAAGERCLLLHGVHGQTNWILLRGNADGVFSLWWKRKDGHSPTTASAICIPDAKGVLRGFRDIAIVGNTLAVATDSGVQYILWKDGAYKVLGNRPPFVPISFGMCRAGKLDKDRAQYYTDIPEWTFNYYTAVNHGLTHDDIVMDIEPTDDDERFWKGTSDQAFGLLLDEVADKVTSKGLFYMPFYVRYSFRLFDGSYSWHSSPVLMLCNVLKPQIRVSYKHKKENGGTFTFTLEDIPFFRLMHRVLSVDPTLSDWSDIVKGVDVFVSPPIFTYSQSENVGYPTSLSAFHGTMSQAFQGHYADTANADYIDHSINTPMLDVRTVCSIAANENFAQQLEEEHRFYRIAEIDIDNIRPLSGLQTLELSTRNTSADSIVTLPQLEDEYLSHAKVIPTLLHTYNNRLSMTGISMSPPQPLPLLSELAASSDVSGELAALDLSAVQTVKVYSRINGTKCVSELTEPLSGFYPFADSFPRYIYHPDPNAYRMVITQPSRTIVLELKQHPFLNGAYWFGGIGAATGGFNLSAPYESGLASVVDVPNKIYTSDVDNPFTFPSLGIVTIGCGRILSISTAAKALSQGQFGQFPMYAFTDDGIWALELSATGSYIARQPITRDVVLVNPDTGKADGITQIDSAVLFPTARGIMMISGSETRCISEPIRSDRPFDIFTLPGLAKVAGVRSHQIYPFNWFLMHCGMIYDYVHQRIIVYSPKAGYAYVYSLKSHQWTLMSADIAYTIPSYPEALAVDSLGNILDFSPSATYGDAADDAAELTSGITTSGVFVTRPLKLDMPDVLKTVDTVIQRGYFSKRAVKSILYGSRDLRHWHLVASSLDHYLRGFRGTPYKYFRIAVVCSLLDDESVYGATVQFNPRYNNQPR